MKSNLEKLRRIETSTQWMLLYPILEGFEKRIKELEKKPKKRIIDREREGRPKMRDPIRKRG